jgi:predicted enzyme related to lactoylglutathione lyase
MSSTQSRSASAIEASRPASVPMRFEVAVLPVADVDRAKAFYAGLGWRLDADLTVDEHYRVVQVTPPGSAASICFGTGLEMMPTGSSQFIQVVVEDADAALAYLRERGVECDGVDEQPWGRFVYFADPDGNRWALQQIVRPS